MKLENSAKKLTNQDIIKFEEELKINLPQDYKDFMLKQNGRKPTKNWAFDFIDVVTSKPTSVM